MEDLLSLLDDEPTRPFFLNDSGEVWMVLDGAVDIFVVHPREGGARRHLHRVAPGDAVFGLGRPAGSDEPGLLAVPTADTFLQKLPPEHWQALLSKPDLQENFADWIDGWIIGLCAGLSSERPPKQALGLSPGQELALKDQGHAFAPGEVLWVDPIQGRVLWQDQDIAPGPFPLAPSSWLTAHGPASLRCLSATPGLPPRTVYAALGQFHARLLAALAAATEQARLDGLNRLRRRAEHDRQLLGRSLGQLASILHARSGDDHGISGIPLADACQRVLRASGIAPRLPAKLPPGADPVTLVNAIARESGAMTRQVALKEYRWWRTDHGPLLGFMKADGRPVALLPERGGYRLEDAGQSAPTRLNAARAAELGDTAVMFFRAFPARAIGLRELLRFGLAGSGRDMVRLVVLGLLGSLLGVFVPYVTGVLIDSVIPAAERDRLLQITLLLVASAFAGAVFEFVRALALLRVEGRMGATIHTAIIDRLLRLPAGFFRDQSAGDLAQRAFGIDGILQLLAGPTQAAVLQGVFSIASFIYLFALNLKLAGIATLLTLVALLATTLLNLRRLKYERQLFKLEGEIASRVLQLLTGVAKLRVAGAEARGFAVWAGAFADKKRMAYRARGLANGLVVFDSAFPVLASLVLFLVIAFLPIVIGTGDFLAFNAAFTQFLTAILGLGTALTTLLNAIPLYERAQPILRTPPEVDEAGATPGELRGAIELSRVNFSYSADGPPILKDIDLRIEPGQFVAFVGPSGSGKSTLFRLLLGFETPTSGAVHYDGQDLAGLNVRAVRRQLGVVLQNGKLMPGDIFTNIVGSAPLTLDDAWEAARLAGLDGDIRAMPMGMHTVIAEGASTLSGGQMQRLMIARALVGRPRILLFDEATSALDNRTQEQVGRSLERLNATRVVIAHRLSTIANADRIYVLERGRIVESGTYKELMERAGRFAELARRQLA